MEKIIEKLEKIISNYLDDFENRPVRTLVVSLVVYYLFRTLLSKTKG